MKQPWFNTKLYWDGIRQLRITGILFTILVCLVSVPTPFMQWLSYVNETAPYFKLPQAATVTFTEMNVLLPMLFCVIAPVMMLQLFSFLNKRESADFYHAIPATRPCLFFSFFAAVMTWVAAIILISTALVTVAYAIFPQLYLVNYASIFPACFNCFAGSLLVAASVGIAMALSGTFATNVLVSLMLIFLPRLLLQLMLSGIVEAFPLVEGLSVTPLLDFSYNVPVGYVFSVFSGRELLSFTQWQSGLYTVILGILYTALAVVLFTRRPSEAAARSAPGKKLQAVYRFLVGFSISCIVTFSLFTDTVDGYVLSLRDVVLFTLLYVVTLLAALTYELLCCRSFKGLFKKALSTAGLLLIFNLLLYGAMDSSAALLRSYTPEAEDIRSVRIITSDTSYQEVSTEYFSALSSDIELTDLRIREFVSRQLKFSIESLPRPQAGDTHYLTMTVAIQDGLFTHQRKLWVTASDLQALTENLVNNEQFRTAYTTLPESVSAIQSTYYSNTVLYESPEEMNALYTALREDVAALGFEQWYALMNGHYSSSYGPITSLRVQLVKNYQWYYFEVPLYPSLLPKTCDAYIRAMNRKASADLSHILKNLDPIESFELEMVNASHPEYNNYYYSGNPELDRARIQSWLDEQRAAANYQAIYVRKPFFKVTVGAYDETKSYYNHYTFYFQPEDLTVPSWLVG